MQLGTIKTLLIVWHSRTGTAEALAEAAAQGAHSVPGVETHLLRAQEAESDDLLRADGFIFACPENLASMSGAMKEMVDRCYYPLLDQIAGRPYALMIAAGTDGEGAVRQWLRIVTGWRLRAMQEPMILRTGADSPQSILAPKLVPPAALADATALGAAMATGLDLGIF